MKGYVTQAQAKEWKRLYRGGASAERIASEVGVGADLVRKQLVQLGVKLRGAGRQLACGGYAPVSSAQTRHITDAVVQKWVKRYAARETPERIAIDYDVSSATVRSRLKDRGVALRGPGAKLPVNGYGRKAQAARVTANQNRSVEMTQWNDVTPDGLRAAAAALWAAGHASPGSEHKKVGTLLMAQADLTQFKAGVALPPAITPVVVTPEMARNWVDGYNGGKTLTQLGQEAGVSFSLVRKHLRAAGVTMRPQGRQASKAITIPETRQGDGNKWVEAYKAGATLRAISAATGHAASTIRKELVGRGVDIRSRGGVRAVGQPRGGSWHQKALEMKKQGVRVPTIAHEFQVTTAAVYQALHRAKAQQVAAGE